MSSSSAPARPCWGSACSSSSASPPSRHADGQRDGVGRVRPRRRRARASFADAASVCGTRVLRQSRPCSSARRRASCYGFQAAATKIFVQRLGDGTRRRSSRPWSDLCADRLSALVGFALQQSALKTGRARACDGLHQRREHDRLRHPRGVRLRGDAQPRPPARSSSPIGALACRCSPCWRSPARRLPTV